jgi:hypothetical protein
VAPATQNAGAGSKKLGPTGFRTKVLLLVISMIILISRTSGHLFLLRLTLEVGTEPIQPNIIV